jgi:hypothetical protein
LFREYIPQGDHAHVVIEPGIIPEIILNGAIVVGYLYGQFLSKPAVIKLVQSFTITSSR